MKTIALFSLGLITTGALAATVQGPQYTTTRALGMGGACVAVADDRTALYSNPAGLNVFKEGISFSLPALALDYDPNTLFLSLLTGTRLAHFGNPGQVDRTFVEELQKVEGEHIRNTVLPEADLVFRNMGVGIYGVSWLDAVYDMGLYQPKLTYQSQTDLVITAAFSKRVLHALSLGLSADYIYRLQAPQTLVWGENIGDIVIGDLFGDDLGNFVIGDVFDNGQDTLDLNEDGRNGLALDAGAIYHAGLLRLGLTIDNVWGTLGDDDLDRRFNVGAAYWVSQFVRRGLVERFVLAGDVADLGGGGDFWTKVHLGAEMELPLGALRAGFNQGYPTWGFAARFMLFHIEFTDYSKELGEYAGHLRDRSYLLALRIGL